MVNKKLEKYLIKYKKDRSQKYLNKIVYHMIDNNVRGGDNNEKKFIIKGDAIDIQSVLSYIEQINAETKSNTKNKYLFILFAPPASGKSIATKYFAPLILKKIFGETDVADQDFDKTCINTGIDDIVYMTFDNSDKATKEILRTKSDENIGTGIPKDDAIKIAKGKIEELSKTSFDIYNNVRKKTDIISEVLIYMGVLLKKNIILETSSGDANYLQKIMESLSYYRYIPIILYPFVSDINILYDRSVSRGIDQGRYIKCNIILEQMRKCIDNYVKVKRIMAEKISRYCIYKYDADDTKDPDNLEQYAIEIIYTSTYINREYNKKIVTDCK